MTNVAPRLTRLADDHQEAVQRLRAEFLRAGLTASRKLLIDEFQQIGQDLEFEAEMRNYRESLDRADIFGRRMRRIRGDIERTYDLTLPALPVPLPALGDGE